MNYVKLIRTAYHGAGETTPALQSARRTLSCSGQPPEVVVLIRDYR